MRNSAENKGVLSECGCHPVDSMRPMRPIVVWIVKFLTTPPAQRVADHGGLPHSAMIKTAPVAILSTGPFKTPTAYQFRVAAPIPHPVAAPIAAGPA